jgi:putative ABC transport system permease protein
VNQERGVRPSFFQRPGTAGRPGQEQEIRKATPMWLDQFLQDVRFGARNLAKSPGFTALAVLSLALGIMATTAIYSVVHGVVLDPFPYKDVDNLMSVRVSNAAARGYRTGYSVDQFLEIAERSTIFEGVIASTISDVLWTGEGDPQRLRGNYGTFNTFDVMGVPPLAGRTPTAADARSDAEPVAVLGYKFWMRQFGGDSSVIGRQLRLNDKVRTVIGVMPKRFMWRGADVYLPITFQRGQVVEGVRGVHVLGRLKPGVTEPQAEADLRPIIADLKAREPAQFPDTWRVGLLSFKETFPSGIRGDLWVLFGAVGLLLLIACANVSNLLLSKTAARQREMTVRAALGADRRRLARQLLTESLLLALAAGIVGTALAYAGLPAILALVPPNTIPDESEIVLNRSVLAFTLLISLLTSVIFGLAPALHATGVDLANRMRDAARGVAGSTKGSVLRNTLVVAEVTLAVMLLAGSSLLVRTFLAMHGADLSAPPERILTMRVPLAPQKYPDVSRRVAFMDDLLQRIAAVPGVAAVGLNTGLHPLGNMWTQVDVAGAPPTTEPVQIHQINADYTSALGIRLVTGRLLTRSDITGAHAMAVVNERFVRARLEGRPALGQIVRIPRLKAPPFTIKDDAFQIVGVVADTLNEGLANPVMPEIYLPFTTAGVANQLAVRTAMDPANVTRTIVEQVFAIDRNQPVADVKRLDVVLQEYEYARPRFNLALLSVFATIGLALSIVGVYGVMSAVVSQQTHEIGVRMALGAGSGTIARMVVGRGSRLLIVGVVLGLIGSVAAASFLARQVWNVSPFDPLAFAIVSLTLLVTGLQACYWPARRAAKIDPIIALRQE